MPLVILVIHFLLTSALSGYILCRLLPMIKKFATFNGGFLSAFGIGAGYVLITYTTVVVFMLAGFLDTGTFSQLEAWAFTFFQIMLGVGYTLLVSICSKSFRLGDSLVAFVGGLSLFAGILTSNYLFVILTTLLLSGG